MTRRTFAFGALAVAAALAAACVVDIPDVVDGGAEASADASDASQDAPSQPDAIVPACEAGACSAPAGFAPILFASDRSAACPSTTSTFDLPADPNGTNGACTCDCNVTTPPACAPQTLTHHIDDDDGGACGQSSGFAPAADGGCNVENDVPVSEHWEVSPFAPTGPGTCAGAATGDATNVTTASSRLCVDPSCGTCAAPAGFQVCYAAVGDVACPASTTQHVAGTSASVTCSSCSSCTVTAECGGTVALYSDVACQTLIGPPVGVDGGCTATGSVGTTLGSLRYVPAVVDLACKPGKSSPTGTSMISPVTICCP